MTPLMWAASNGATAAVASLIKLRANLDAQHHPYG
jgi:ankyrin repeat protein